MYKIKVQNIHVMDFEDLGSFYDMLKPRGFHMGSLYPDKVICPVSGSMPMAFSSYVVQYAEEMLVPGAEYHSYTPDIILPLDGDIIYYAAPASSAPHPELMRAFRIPRGTMVCLNAGVWHQSAFAVGREPVHALVGLPQRTYKNDTTHVEFPVGDWVKIEAL